MTCALLADPLVDSADVVGDCGWDDIAAAVRRRAAQLQSEASDLLEWAELLEGIAALEAHKG